MTFQEMRKTDLDNVFFNTGEFASEHQIDGKMLTVILREDHYSGAKTRYGQSSGNINPKEDAINRNVLTLRIRETDVHRKLTAGAMIDVDGKKMFISDVKHPSGMYILTIERHKV